MTMSLIHASTLPSTIGYGLLSFVAAIIIFKTLVASCSSFFDVSLLYTVSYFLRLLPQPPCPPTAIDARIHLFRSDLVFFTNLYPLPLSLTALLTRHIFY
ncbi:hypothetical protein BKA81DRAFT_135887 [Phyllosticta paracitricarpa]